MQEIKEYIKQPSTIWKIIVWLFMLGMVWANLMNEISAVKTDVVELKSLNLDARLTSMEVDIKRIRHNIDNTNWK